MEVLGESRTSRWQSWIRRPPAKCIRAVREALPLPQLVGDPAVVKQVRARCWGGAPLLWAIVAPGAVGGVRARCSGGAHLAQVDGNPAAAEEAHALIWDAHPSNG